MCQLARTYPRFGYRRIQLFLKDEGWNVNNKRVYRLWRREGLKVRRKTRKRRYVGQDENSCHRQRAEGKNDVWCWDFIFDRTESGSQLKWLSIVDEYTRECLVLTVGKSITSEDVINQLASLIKTRGVPNYIRSDNGPEFIAKNIQRWLERLEVKTRYVAPGAPWQNGFAESFHSKMRDEFLNIEIFENLASARKLTEQFQHHYNHGRPHSSLGNVTPAAFADQCLVVGRPLASLQLSTDR